MISRLRRWYQPHAAIFGGTFAPSDLSNLTLWLDASTGVYSDAGTTLAVNNDTVQQWSDRSTSAAHASQASAGSRPTYKTGIFNGKPVLRFSAHRLDTTSFLDASYNTAMTLFIVDCKTTVNLKMSTAHGTGNRWWSTKDANGTYFQASQLSVTQTSTKGKFIYTSPAVYMFRYNGSSKSVRALQSAISTTVVATTGNVGLSGALTIGDLPAGGYANDGDIAEIILYNRALTDAQMMQVEGYLANKYTTLDARYLATDASQVIFVGDSLTLGTGSTGGETYPKQCVDILGATSWLYTNTGVSGTTVPTMTTNALITADPLIDPYRARPHQVCVLFGGTNDLQGGATAATTYTNIQTFCAARRSAGFKVIVVTMLPRTPGTYETGRQDLNTSIRTNWASFADGLADAGNDATIGQAGQYSNTTYYVDGTHCTNAGYAIVASLVATAIAAL